MGTTLKTYSFAFLSVVILVGWHGNAKSQGPSWPHRGSQSERQSGWGRGSDANDGPSVPSTGGIKWPTKIDWGTSSPDASRRKPAGWPSSSHRNRPTQVQLGDKATRSWQYPEISSSRPNPLRVPSSQPLPIEQRATVEPNLNPPTTNPSPPSKAPRNAPPPFFALNNEYGDYGAGPAFGTQGDESTDESNINDDVELMNILSPGPKHGGDDAMISSHRIDPERPEREVVTDTNNELFPNIHTPSLVQEGSTELFDSKTDVKREKLGREEGELKDGTPLGNFADDMPNLGADTLDDQIIHPSSIIDGWPASDKASGKSKLVEWPSSNPSKSTDRGWGPSKPFDPNPGVAKGNSGLSINPWDPKRPGIQGGDLSIDGPFTDFIDNRYIDPKTGQMKSKTTGIVFEYNLPWDNERKDVPKFPEPTKGDLKYWDAVDRANKANKGSIDKPTTMDNDTIKTSAPSRPSTKSNVTITIGEGFPERFVPDTWVKKAESVLNNVVDGVESLVPDSLRKEPRAIDSEVAQPAPIPTHDDQEEPSLRRRTAEEKQEFRRQLDTKNREAELRWQKEEGDAFTKRFGTRPVDPSESAQWDKKREQRIQSWKFHESEKANIFPEATPGGIRN